MSDTTVIKKKGSRGKEYAAVLVVILLLVSAAAFQEQISAFFRLKMWDKGAPARAVEQFLAAGKKGDQQAVMNLLGSKEFQELKSPDGKWRGFFIVSQAGVMEFDFADLAPSGEPKAVSSEIETIGNGHANVEVPDSKGKPTRYRVELKDGSWKITEILGGKPRTPPPAAKGEKKPTPKAPGSK